MLVFVFLTGIRKSRIICVKAKNLDRIDICSVEKLKSVMATMQVLSTRYFFLQLAIILRNCADTAELAKIRRHSARLSRIIVLLLNTLMTKHRFIAEKLNFICQKKKEKLVTFSRARTGMNESGSFVQV